MSRKPDERRKFATDPLMDACLDEVLAGKRPPDLKARILAQLSLEASKGDSSERDSSKKPISSNLEAGGPQLGIERPTVERTAAILPQIVTHNDHSPSHRARSSRTQARWQSITIGACVLGLLASVVFVNRDRFVNRDQLGIGQTPVAQSGADVPSTLPANRPSGGVAPTDAMANRPPDAIGGPADRLANSSRSNGGKIDGELDRRRMADTSDLPLDSKSDQLVESRDVTTTVDDGDHADRNAGSPTQTARLSDAEVIARINDQLRAAQELAGVSAGVAISDEQWCVRAFERLVGRSPRTKELELFVASTAIDKREAMVDQLLGNAYADEFAAYWAERWSGWLLGRMADRRNTLKTYHAGLSRFLATSLKDDASYRDIAVRLLTAEGSNEPSRDDYDPATNFLLATLDNEVTEVTSQVCRTMLGQRARCAQCHDDSRSKFKQDQFWSLASVFKSLDVQRLRLGRGRVEDQVAVEAMRYQDDSGEWMTASPPVPAADELASRSARQAVAEKLVSSTGFRQAAINRFWSQLLQYGFTFPIDDMGSHNLVSHPQLLELVSDQFAAADFDVQSVLKWIVLSNAFDRADRIDGGNLKDFPDGGSVALFSRDYYRPTVFAKASEGLNELAAGRRPQVAFSTDESDPTVMQARRVKDLDAKERGVRSEIAMGQLLPVSYLRSVRELADGQLTPEEQVNHAFLMTLSRRPDDAERDKAQKIFDATPKDDQVAALERIFWALLNTEAATK